MAKLHHLGFPRIGNQRQLKYSLEKFWAGKQTEQALLASASQLRNENWHSQQALDFNFHTVGDFSLYDQVLDTSLLLGNLPKRAIQGDNQLDNYFRVARGRSQQKQCCSAVHGGESDAGEMTKWFNTNYHYIVPEFDSQTQFSLHPENLLTQIKELQKINTDAKVVIIGPVTYLWLGKEKDQSSKLDLLPQLLKTYQQLLALLHENNIQWLQIDEPILALELEDKWQEALKNTYQQLSKAAIKLLLTTYFGELKDNLSLACQLPVAGLHIDAINGKHEVPEILKQLSPEKVLSIGVINGCNIWKTDLNETLQWLIPVHEQLKDRLWLAPSSSLLHVPVDLQSENKLDPEVKNWLAFATQKLQELSILGRALNEGIESVFEQLAENKLAISSRKNSTRIHNPAVQQAVSKIDSAMGERQQGFTLRNKIQKESLNLPHYPTTTIGSFPQTQEIRATRKAKRLGEINDHEYQQQIQKSIRFCIEQQNKIGLDVLVHGEAERNDMVEYFGELLEGFVFTQSAWVQSYGSRCVKPPVLFGDVSRP